MSAGEMNVPKVLYIMGTARSGSTILEILLSKGDGVFGAGELTSLIQDGFVENKPCSCGALCDGCDVWGEVREKMGLDDEGFYQWAILQQKIDWHDGFLRRLFHLLPVQAKNLYNDLNTRLIHHIQTTTGCQVVLDASKYAGRALALSVSTVEVHVVCLTRSPAGLLQSFQKPNKDEQRPKSIISTLVYYCVTLSFLRVASVLLGNKVLHLRYEDLLVDPVLCVRKIAKWSHIDFSVTLEKLQNNEAFTVGHLVTGNRLRKQKEIRFNPEADTVSPKGMVSRIAVAIMSGWGWVLRF